MKKVGSQIFGRSAQTEGYSIYSWSVRQALDEQRSPFLFDGQARSSQTMGWYFEFAEMKEDESPMISLCNAGTDLRPQTGRPVPQTAKVSRRSERDHKGGAEPLPQRSGQSRFSDYTLERGRSA